MKKAIKITAMSLCAAFLVGFCVYANSQIGRTPVPNQHDYAADKVFNKQFNKLSNLDMIRCNSDFNFSKQTKVVKIDYYDASIGGGSLEGILKVAQKEIDTAFPKTDRNYHLIYLDHYVVVDYHLKNIDFFGSFYQNVDDGKDEDSEDNRQINYIVMKPENGYREVYLCIDHLGWRNAEVAEELD